MQIDAAVTATRGRVPSRGRVSAASRAPTRRVAVTPNRFPLPASVLATATAASITRFVDGTRIVVAGVGTDREPRSPASSRKTVAT